MNELTQTAAQSRKSSSGQGEACKSGSCAGVPQNFTFFMRSGAIEEVSAFDKEAALDELCKRIGKSRYWTLQEVETCCSRDTMPERLRRQGMIFNHNGKCGKIVTK